MFREKPTAYDRLSNALSDIGERIAELEEQVGERFDPRPSRTERMRRALARNVSALHGAGPTGASRYLPEFMAGWSLPTAAEARYSLQSLRHSARHGADEARSHLPDFRLARIKSFRRGAEAERGLQYLRAHPGTSTLLILGGVIVAVGAAYYVTKKVQDHAEEPDYDTVRKDGAIEIRDYDSMIVAETIKSGYHEKARRSGFDSLADYIFAKNRSGKKINMTTPVLQQLSESEGRTKGWAVRFVMPKKFTKSSLPQPGTSDVDLKEVPARRIVAIRFSGNFTASLASKHLMTLYNYLGEENLKQKGDPEYAFYNPPWTPGFMKRNEILIEVER